MCDGLLMSSVLVNYNYGSCHRMWATNPIDELDIPLLSGTLKHKNHTIIQKNTKTNKNYSKD